MNRHRLRDVSVIPQYAMSALNPTRKIGRMTSRPHQVRVGPTTDNVLEEFKRRIDLVGSTRRTCLNMYPFEMSGGMRQRDDNGHFHPAQPLAAHRGRGHVGSGRVHPARRRGNADGVQGPRLRKEHDRDHPRPVGPGPDSRHASWSCTPASSPKRPAPATIVDHPLHPYTQLLLGFFARGRRSATTRPPLTGIPGRPPSLLNPPTGCRFRDRCPFAFDKCAEEPPFVELRPGHEVACWKAMEDNGPPSPNRPGQGAGR